MWGVAEGIVSDDLGEALTGVYPIPGGRAQVFTRGLTIATDAGASTIVSFAFPMIGRPSIITGASPSPFEPHAINFHLRGWSEATLSASIQSALAGRLCLVPTGRLTPQLALTVGPAGVVRAEEHGPGDVVRPALWGSPVARPAGLEDRQLYDVAVIDGGPQPRVIAPHAVYHRQTWTDFGIAHITDMHVARRIDRFRGLLSQAGLGDAARRVVNWNDRFRGFVRYANYLHARGLLDVIVATGDLYDYMFEDEDDPALGGNAAFLRRLILGQAPGPDFQDVEELLVPILMTPGNHDYRKHPYKLRFDLLESGLKPFREYTPYRLEQSEAVVLTNRLDGLSGDGVQELLPEGGGRMIMVDPDIQPYKAHLGDTGSYVVNLGIHRIAMVDSAHDAGLPASTSLRDLGRFLVRTLYNQDAAALVGSSPNCEGVSLEELEAVTLALRYAPPAGLFIVGLHAPLFNPDEYPFFLRETQREALWSQAYAFLARHDRKPLPDGSDINKKIRERHPSWFGEGKPYGTVPFVKRLGAENANDDLMDHGVSRGYADKLMRVLAGTESRAADVVLAGHTHCHNEFVVRATSTGALAYFMDFYTQNPSRYYATRFWSSWAKQPTGPNQPANLVPVTAVTSVEVVPGAAPNGSPWPLPHEADTVTHHVVVPPYPTPLSHTADPRAWWQTHRPLVLQTGALGPFKGLDDFSGFRVLSVRNDVIARIDFVPMVRLEPGYRLAWEEAIRPDPPRPYRYVQRSLRHQTPAAVGAPCGISFFYRSVASVVYRDEKGRFHELWETPYESGARNLTDLADNAIRADGDPTAYIDTILGYQAVYYRAQDGHVHSLYWAGGEVRRDELGKTAGAPKAARGARPIGFMQQDGSHVAIYRKENGHLQSLAWRGTNAPTTEQLTGSDGSPAAVGDPAPFTNAGGVSIVVYAAPDRDIHALHWRGIEDPVHHENLSAAATGAPKAAGPPVAYYTAHDDTHHVIYRGGDKHLHELWWVGETRTRHRDLMVEASGAEPAESDPVAWFGAAPRTEHFAYRSADGHLHHLSRRPGGSLVHVDLTLEALAPPASDRPAAFSMDGVDSQHVVYRGTDGQIHEIRWFDRASPALLQNDWRWCSKCQGLFYGPYIGTSRCPAGDAHAAPAQSGSASYALPYGASGAGGQADWSWCNRCDGLFYGPGAGTSVCAAGGAHAAPGQSGSANYTIAYGWDGGPGRQSDWRWCSRCQGLFYGPYVIASRCPAGGAHAGPGQTGSRDYNLIIER